MPKKAPTPAWPGAMVKSIRQDLGLSQQDLAKAAGAHPNSVQRLEAGIACTIPTLELLLSAMGYEINFVRKEGPRQMNTPRRDDVLRLYVDEKLSCKEVGARLGLGEKTITALVHDAGLMRLPGRISPGSTPALRQEASYLFHVEGIKNRAKIARMLGLSYRAVHRAVDLRLHLDDSSVG